MEPISRRLSAGTGDAGIRRLSSAERTRLALLKAALHLFGQKGFEATSTREIAAAAKANIGSIAYHFGGKEGLRAACADHVVEAIGSLVEQALGGLHADNVAPVSPEEAEAILTRAVETIIVFVVARPEAGEIAQFVLRELSKPTSALDIIYDGVFEPVHRALCRIWATATGEEPESERTRIIVFTIIGQVIYFRIAREAVRRRMGWDDIGGREAAVIAQTAKSNVAAIIADRRGAQ